MKKTSGTASFAVTFRKLSLAVETSQEQAKSHLDAAAKARVARFNQLVEHLKAGGKLSQKQLDLLPEPERSFANVAMLASDADLKKAAAEIEKTVAEGAKRAATAFARFLTRV